MVKRKDLGENFRSVDIFCAFSLKRLFFAPIVEGFEQEY